MTMTQYRLIHGIPGLKRLADACNQKVGYFVTLSYTRSKEPSLSLAREMVMHSGGQLDYDSLCRSERTVAEPA